MGNNPSKPSGSVPDSPTVNNNSQLTPGATPRREPKRRDSIQALSTGKATAAPPSASLTSATAHPSSQNRTQNSHSRQRSQTVELSSPRPLSSTETMGNEQSHQRSEGQENGMRTYHPSSEPVDVPGPQDAQSTKGTSSSRPNTRYVPPSQLNRAPRLPLPIDEESHTPGSPIISPADVSSALHRDDVDGAFPRRSSILSSTATEEDEIADELHAYTVDGEMRRTIPTVIEWKHGGERVYVTGTFAGWNRKFRLHKNPSGNGLSAVIQLPPGTHHLKFIVDGDMRTSDNLPTAVDYTNILVNYLEVSAGDLTAPTKPIDIQQREIQHPPPGVYPPQILPPTPDQKAVQGSVDAIPPAQAEVVKAPVRYTHKIPEFLLDLDSPEESHKYQRAAAAINRIPPPPSLPMFLGKSILNGSTPMKDDSSVLTMPNHTVLNHLATSSIKDNVLATSATTRYKRKVGPSLPWKIFESADGSKYVTTVMYKPTSENGD
ncbi:MAG: hypothetical protein M1812_002209 [Candelaria pacifica]|nr:MAG: hypothetical protein M1812_002209 [Candelaria pacifica]